MNGEGLRAALHIMKPGDWALIAICVALSIVSAAAVWSPGRETAGLARVYVDQVLAAELPLYADGTHTVTTAGGGSNVIEISGGRARMASATCPDGYCVQQGYIRYDGETVICLPNRVVIELEAEEAGGLDAIAS